MSDQNPPQYPSYPGDQSGQPAYNAPPPGYVPASYPLPAPQYPLAGWWSRVGAYLLDGLILLGVILIPLVVGLIITFKDVETDANGDITSGVSGVGILILVLTALLFFGFDIWNRGIRLGKTGQSLGKKIVGLSAVKAETGEVIGAGQGFLRWLVYTLFGAVSCLQLTDVLWPLWDEKKQTLHDKVVGSVVVRT